MRKYAYSVVVAHAAAAAYCGIKCAYATFVVRVLLMLSPPLMPLRRLYATLLLREEARHDMMMFADDAAAMIFAAFRAMPSFAMMRHIFTYQLFMRHIYMR